MATTATTAAPTATDTSSTSTATRPPSATTRPHRTTGRELAFWLTAIAGALPLLVVRHLPFTDLPEHVAAIATFARLLPGGGGAPYAIAWRTSQYLLYDVSGALLTRVVGDAVLANRLLLAAVAILFPVSLRTLLRAFGRDERLAIFGCMTFWSRATVIGFLPFVASMPVATFALAAVVRHLEQPSRRRAVLLGVLSVALFYAHVSAWLLFALTAAVLIALRRAPRTLLPLLPSAVAAAVWWHGGSLETPTGELAHVERLPIRAVVDALPIWTFEIWRSHVDELCAGIWWGVFALVLALALRRPERGALLPLVPFACAVVVYLVTPFQVGAAGFLDVRLAPLVATLAVLALRLPDGRVADVLLAPVAIASLVMAGDAAFEMRRLEREQLGDLDALLAHAQPGTKLAMLNFQRSSPRANFWPYVFAGSYHRARGGAIASYSFTELAHWPLRYVPGAQPPSRVPFWIYHPCAYRYREDGAFYDYVLVQGGARPFEGDVPGPVFEAVAHEGVFTLYAKTSAPPDDASPDRGPCRAP